jgi:ATP-dependent protease ClpP protease subunit
MKIGHIFINGLIGTVYNTDDSIAEKGVELLDVVEQVESLEGDEETIHVHINSKGGYVSVGDQIAEFIAELPNVHTIAENVCASIATKIHLAAPLQNRWIEDGCNYMIHNPFLPPDSVGGDAAALQKVTDGMKSTEEGLEKMYAKATGLSKTVVSGLMAQTTFMTPEQCLTLKFASLIVKKEQAQPIALMYNETENKNNMKHANRASAALAVLTGKSTVKDQKTNPLNGLERAAKAVMITTNEGTLETPFEDIMIGDLVVIDGEAAAGGTYEITEGEIVLIDGTIAGVGTTITVVDGAISEITPTVVEAENVIVDGEETLETLKAKLATAEADKETAEAALTESNDEKEIIVKQMEQAAALGSTFVAPRVVNQFKETAAPIEDKGFDRDALNSRRAEYKK